MVKFDAKRTRQGWWPIIIHSDTHREYIPVMLRTRDHAIREAYRLFTLKINTDPEDDYADRAEWRNRL